MTIVGFSFSRMEVEKKEAPAGKVSISNNVSIKDITDADLHLGTAKQKAIKFNFEFTTKYDPSVGKIVFTGDVIYLEDAKLIQGIVEDWKKSKKIDRNVMTNVLNAVLSKCNVQALILSQEVNLPSPIPLPKVKMDAHAKAA